MWTVVVPASAVAVPVDGSKATAGVSDTRKLSSLEVTKTVNWNGITPVEGQTFEICISGPSYPAPAKDCKTFTYPADLVKSWTGLIPGDYTVTETDPGNMWTVVVPASAVAVPVDGSKATAGVSDTRKLSSLEVTKTVNWNGITPVEGQTFEICISGPSYPAPAKDCKTFTYPADLVKSWTGLIPGDYTVTETDPGNMWTVVVPASAVAVPVDGSKATAGVSDTRKLSSLEVTKTVNWNGITPVEGQTFEICISGPPRLRPRTARPSPPR